MINLLVKNVFRKIAIKVATDKNLRNKVTTVVNNAINLNEKGELLKTLGKSAGRIKKKIIK